MHRLLRSLGLIAALGFAGGAQALSTTGLEWIKVGGNGPALDISSETCETGPGFIRPGLQGAPNVCVANVLLTVDASGVSLMGVSFTYDTDLANEANFIGGFEGAFTLLGKGNGMAAVVIGLELGTESSAASAGFVRRFDLSAPAPPAAGVTTTNSPTTITIGTIAFAYNTANVTDDGDDIEVGATDAGTDGFFDSLSVETSSTFSPALQLNAPEPSAALLGLAALGTLAALRRGRRH